MVQKLIKHITKKKTKNMKKIVALFAIVATMASCGNGSGKSAEAVDSTAVAVDSVKVDSVAVDSVKTDVEKVEEVK